MCIRDRLWCAQALAATGLAQESTNVYRQLEKDDLPAARKAVSRIVGRDTEKPVSYTHLDVYKRQTLMSWSSRY